MNKHQKEQLEKWVPYSLEGIETDINKRWEQGISHHPKSVEVIKALSALDYAFCNLSLDIETGGDGDNGETMMYLLDIFFEAKDKN